MNKIYVISDMHLTGDISIDDVVAIKAFIDLLKRIKKERVCLLLLGDFFDVQNNSKELFKHKLYDKLFKALSEFSKHNEIKYVLGNHDRLVYKNKELMNLIEKSGIKIVKHKYYHTLIYKGIKISFEHGNQYDPLSKYKEMSNPIESPLAEHISQDLFSLNSGWLKEVWKLRPYSRIPLWLFSKFFYYDSSKTLKLLLLPFFLSLFLTKLIPIFLIYFLFFKRSLNQFISIFGMMLLLILSIDISSLFLFIFIKVLMRDLKSLFLKFGFFSSNSLLNRSKNFVKNIVNVLKKGKTSFNQDLDILICGHTHKVDYMKIKNRIYVNTGCWLKNFISIKSPLNFPKVFIDIPRFNYAEIILNNDKIEIMLHEILVPFIPKLNRLEKFALLHKYFYILKKYKKSSDKVVKDIKIDLRR